MNWISKQSHLFAKGTVRPVDLINSTAILLLLLCERYNLDVRRALEASDRVLADARQNQPLIPRVLARYLKEELRG